MQRFQNILGQCGFNELVNGSFSIVKPQVGNTFISNLVVQFFAEIYEVLPVIHTVP